MIEIYTDGSATKSRSGWGFVAVKNNEIIYQKSGVEHIGDTNQMMELIAALEACKWATNQHYDDIIIYSDSAYLVNCYNDKWFVKWENNNWKNSKNEPVANIDLWKQLIMYFRLPNINFVKVKGHNGDQYNEIADKLATGAIELTDERINLTPEKNYDIIYKEVGEIFINYSINKISIMDAVKNVLKIIEREKNGK